MPEEKPIRSRPLPDDAYEDLALIVSHADKLGQICEAVEQTKTFLNMKNVAIAAAEKTGLAEEKAREVVSVLLNFHRLRSRLELEIDDFVEWLGKFFLEFAQEKNKEELLEAWEKGLASIKGVLDEGSAVGILNKAIGLVYAHQNVLGDARLLTDLRPVYDKGAKKILRMVITHQLVLEYTDGASDKRLYLAIDASDIEKLEHQCKRARDKADVALQSSEECDWITHIVGENDE